MVTCGLTNEGVPVANGFSRMCESRNEVDYAGELEYEVEGKPPVTLKPGDVLFIPAGTVHAAKNVGNRKGAELATYIVEKGKPLLREAGDRAPRSAGC